MNLQPLLSKERKDAKSLIVAVLAKEFPLPAKQIYNKIVKANPTVKLTYQAVHKALKQLEVDGVLESNGGYRLSVFWVERLKGFGDDVFKKYVKKTPLDILSMQPYSTVETHWDGQYIQPYYWMLDQSYKLYCAKPVPSHAVFMMRRCWPCTVIGDEERKKMTAIFTCPGEQYVVVGSSSPADRLLTSLWDGYGFKTRAGVPLSFPHDIYVFQEFVFQIFEPKETKKKWDELYQIIDESNCKDLRPTHVLAYVVKTKATFVVTRNPEFAESLRAQARALVASK